MHTKATPFDLPAGLLRTLVAAADVAQRERLTSLLTHAGHTCDTAATGSEVLAAVGRQKYILAFVQTNLPGAGAAEVTRQIREAERAVPGARRMPVIALCPDEEAHAREQCLLAGVDTCLSTLASDQQFLSVSRSLVKPLTSEIPGLPKALAALLQQVPLAAEADEAATSAEPLAMDDLLCRCMGNRQLARDLLLKFSQRAPADVDRLSATLTAGDAAQSARLAHGIKGVAANLAAARVQAAAAEVERLILAADLAQATAALGRLREQVDLCLQYIPAAVGLGEELLPAGKEASPCAH